MKLDIEKIKQKKSIKDLINFGIINIDKSRGPTSFNVSEFLKKSLKLTKTSHFGTLDPAVTGVLPVALNRACKLAGYFLGEDKEYVGIMQIHKDMDLDKIQKVIDSEFTGIITQLPPIKSRVKREPRKREIYQFKLIEKDGQNILFKVKCQGGTYIRKLCTDLGDRLNIGAHMLELRRISAGIFSEYNQNYPAVSLYDFQKALADYENGNEKSLRKIIMPAEIVQELFPVIHIKESAKKRIYHGSPIHNDELEDSKFLDFEIGQKLVVFSGKDFIGIFRVIKEANIFARSEFTLQPI